MRIYHFFLSVSHTFFLDICCFTPRHRLAWIPSYSPKRSPQTHLSHPISAVEAGHTLWAETRIRLHTFIYKFVFGVGSLCIGHLTIPSPHCLPSPPANSRISYCRCAFLLFAVYTTLLRTGSVSLVVPSLQPPFTVFVTRLHAAHFFLYLLSTSAVVSCVCKLGNYFTVSLSSRFRISSV